MSVSYTTVILHKMSHTHSMSAVEQLSIALLSLWVCVSVAGNLSIIACIWRASTQSRKRSTCIRRSSVTSTDVLIVSLAVNDIILAGIVLPEQIHCLSHTDHFFESQ